jgi:hypothetical protein
MSSEELEEAIRNAIRESLGAGVRPEAMVITFGALRWRWSAALGRWDVEHVENIRRE